MISSLLKVRIINIEQAVTIFGRGFTAGCAHPLVETIKEYEDNPSLDFTETTLYEYHAKFKPKNTNAALGITEQCNGLPLFQYPWGGFRLSYQGNKDQLSSRFCGPSNDGLVRDEFNTTIALYNDIKKNGYKLIRNKSIIGGTFLVKENGEKRFVVLQGNHRMSVLSALGYKNLFVYTMKGYQEYIRESSLNDWIMLNKVSCPNAISRKVFNAFFDGKNNVEY